MFEDVYTIQRIIDGRVSPRGQANLPEERLPWTRRLLSSSYVHWGDNEVTFVSKHPRGRTYLLKPFSHDEVSGVRGKGFVRKGDLWVPESDTVEQIVTFLSGRRVDQLQGYLNRYSIERVMPLHFEFSGEEIQRIYLDGEPDSALYADTFSLLVESQVLS